MQLNKFKKRFFGDDELNTVSVLELYISLLVAAAAADADASQHPCIELMVAPVTAKAEVEKKKKVEKKKGKR
eukprot:366216-Chlamydomonas_euryale.AAC.7